MRLSVIVPTLNEVGYLPRLLGDLAEQSHPPDEVIVVDATSTDGTADLARSMGARVSPDGGLPGVARNVGAGLAHGEWLLFVDADVRLAPDVLAVAMAAVTARELDGASTWFSPEEGGAVARAHHWFSSAYFLLTTWLRFPHSIGGFILVRRSMHEQLSGFDTTILVAEDEDYVRRMARIGRYAFLRRPVVRISTRRFANSGFLRQSFKWLLIEAHRLFLGEIRSDRFRYFSS